MIFTPRNAGGIINANHTSGTSSDESFENESETTIRVVTTQMMKSTEIIKDLIISEIRKEIWREYLDDFPTQSCNDINPKYFWEIYKNDWSY